MAAGGTPRSRGTGGGGNTGSPARGGSRVLEEQQSRKGSWGLTMGRPPGCERRVRERGALRGRPTSRAGRVRGLEASPGLGNAHFALLCIGKLGPLGDRRFCLGTDGGPRSQTSCVLTVTPPPHFPSAARGRRYFSAPGFLRPAGVTPPTSRAVD